MTTPYLINTPAGRLSGRISGPTRRPRGLVLVLHGGTYDSGYYNTGAGSLLDVGAALGLCVIAIDRPGYGTSTPTSSDSQTFAAQAQLLAMAAHQIDLEFNPENGTVLIGHSIGGMIALHVAALGIPQLKGLEVSGIGARWRPGMLEMWSSFISDQATITVPPEPHANVMFGPPGTFTDEQRALDATLIRAMPMSELVDVLHWTDVFPDIASKISVPVRLVFPEHDNIWEVSDDARAQAGSYFIKSPSAEVQSFAETGHSIELHKNGPIYTLDQLNYVLQCQAKSL